MLLLLAAFCFYVSQRRLIDDDEGFYLLASRLVMQHRAPYLDFFYTQAPLLPYVFAAWFKLTKVSWYSARTLCAVLSTAVGGLMYVHVCRETSRWLAGACAVLLFATSTLIFCWYPIVKTFALAMLFLFIAYMILVRLMAATPGWLIAIAGALFGLSVDTRSYVVGIAPVFLWWLLRRQQRRWAHLAWFAGGFLIGIIPSLILFFASPDAYLFNNLGYHAVRSDSGLIGNWRNKLVITAAIVGGAYTGFQFTVTSLTALILTIVMRARRLASLFALVLAIAIGIVSSLPTPGSIQYFSLVMPFLIVAAVCSVSDFLMTLRSAQAVRVAKLACTALVLAFVGFGVPVFRDYLFTGKGVPGLRDVADTPNWTLRQVTAVSQAVDKLVIPGEEVASFWPGYIFASSADPYPGFENNFGMYVAPKFTRQKRRHYHILTAADMRDLFVQRAPRLTIVGNQGEWNAAPDYRASVAVLRENGYTLIEMVGDTAIFASRPGR